jgi:DNA repair exonuclease SbcCD nuclease subunit
MDTITILHTSDNHLMERQYGRSYRGDDMRKAFHAMIDIAIERKVTCIINGGDTFQFKRPGTRLQAVLLEAHGRLKSAGIPMYVVTGNHDASEPSLLEFPALQDWYGNLTRMPDEDALEVFRRERRLESMAGIVCIDNSRVRLPNGMTLAGFPACVDNNTMLAELRSNPADIVVWHGAVEEFVPFPMPNSLSMVYLDLPGIKAWLLGDIHLPGVKRTTEHDCLVAYPGPLEMCEKGEEAEKKVDIYTVKAGAPFPDPEFVRVPNRKALFLTVNDDTQADAACEKVMAALREHPGGILIYLSYDKKHREIVSRINSIIDPRTTVFLASQHKTEYRQRAGKMVSGGRPELAEVLAEVVPPGSRLNEICRSLAERGKNSRPILVEWIDQRLKALGADGVRPPEILQSAPAAPTAEITAATDNDLF